MIEFHMTHIDYRGKNNRRGELRCNNDASVLKIVQEGDIWVGMGGGD